MYAHVCQNLTGFLTHLTLVEDAGHRLLAICKDVSGDRKMWEKYKFLGYDADAGLAGLQRGIERDGFIAKKYLSAVGLVDPSHDFHEGRFACAVFADESMDLALRNRDRDIAQRIDTAKSLADVFNTDHFWLAGFCG